MVIGRIGVGIGLIELGIGLIELGIGLIGLWMGLIELGMGLMELGIGLGIITPGAPSWPVYPALFISFPFLLFLSPRRRKRANVLWTQCRRG